MLIAGSIVLLFNYVGVAIFGTQWLLELQIKVLFFFKTVYLLKMLIVFENMRGGTHVQVDIL